MDQKPKLRLGELLVKNRVITEEQLAEAIERQQELGGMLGDILISLGYLDELTLIRYLTKNKIRPRLGEMLVARNELSREQLLEAVEHQKKSGEKLGIVLLKLGLLDKHKLVHYLTLQSQSLINTLGDELSIHTD